MVSLENDIVKASFSAKGAEVVSLIYKNTGQEYLWQGKSDIWERQNPVLFPVIASLENDRYHESGVDYSIGIHGFGLHSTFILIHESSDCVRFRLTDDELSRLIYPFRFILEVEYKLVGPAILIVYTVLNPDNKVLKFCIGGHPTFACPLGNSSSFEDYYLQFEKTETLQKLAMSGPYMNGKKEVFIAEGNRIGLNKSLFIENAVILEAVQSSFIEYRSYTHEHGIRLNMNGFPYFGIYSNPNSDHDDYICLEPWFGLPAEIGKERTLDDKPGLIKLDANQVFEASYSIELF